MRSLAPPPPGGWLPLPARPTGSLKTAPTRIDSTGLRGAGIRGLRRPTCTTLLIHRSTHATRATA
jgi:hypothetical protein